jgi:hypothetical protein
MTQDDIISKEQDMTSNTIAFFMSNGSKEVMRITADSVSVAPDVSVNDAAATVIAALEQHIKNIVAAEREACAKVCDGIGDSNKWSDAHDCAAAIRSRSKT